MAGGAKAVSSGDELAKLVCDLATRLGLDVHEQFKVARRLWGAERRIDVILKDPKQPKRSASNANTKESVAPQRKRSRR